MPCSVSCVKAGSSSLTNEIEAILAHVLKACLVDCISVLHTSLADVFGCLACDSSTVWHRC